MQLSPETISLLRKCEVEVVDHYFNTGKITDNTNDLALCRLLGCVQACITISQIPNPIIPIKEG